MGVNVPKNLIYFIYYGGKINHYHRLNLSLLNKYWSLFDGKKVVKVAIDGKVFLEPLKSLLPSDCKIELVENNRIMGESVHFIDSIKRVNDGITFYAHCKSSNSCLKRDVQINTRLAWQLYQESVPLNTYSFRNPLT